MPAGTKAGGRWIPLPERAAADAEYDPGRDQAQVAGPGHVPHLVGCPGHVRPRQFDHPRRDVQSPHRAIVHDQELVHWLPCPTAHVKDRPSRRDELDEPLQVSQTLELVSLRRVGLGDPVVFIANSVIPGHLVLVLTRGAIAATDVGRLRAGRWRQHASHPAPID